MIQPVSMPPEVLGKTRRPLPALVATAGVAAAITGQNLLASLSAWIAPLLYEQASFGPTVLSNALWQPQGLFAAFVSMTLPFSLGVFLCFALALPITAHSTMRAAVLRSVLAAMVGAFAVVVVSLVLNLVQSQRYGFGIRGFAHSGVLGASSAIQLLITAMAIVVLAGVLLRTWLVQRGLTETPPVE